MDDFRSIGVRHSYTGRGDKILREFLLPVLDNAVSYDRITSFYTVASLLAISQGVQSLYRHGGSMRLIIGIHSFPPELATAAVRREYLEEQVRLVRQEVEEGLASIANLLTRRRLATLAWMIEDGLLTVKAATVRGEGIFHPKTLLFRDVAGNEIAAVGSSNETGSGLGGNFEQLMVATSWDMRDAVDDQKRFFESLWQNKSEDTSVIDMNDQLLASLHTALGNDRKRLLPAPPRLADEERLIACAAQMPANFFVSGSVPALFQHQEHAVIQALSRWPVRVLFADEVGLGKTFEAAATLAFLMRFCGVRRVVILTPKSVMLQWQDELAERFGIEAWAFDSQRKRFVDPSGAQVAMGNRNPLGKESPDIVLMSAQYARGSAGKEDVFSRAGTLLPDVLVLDEAHSARVSVDISGKRTATRMHRMLEGVVRKIPHVILATATPMQRDAEEYHALLGLLGLTNMWKRPKNYRTSLSLTVCEELAGFDDAASAGKLLRSVLRNYKPSLDSLTSAEREAVRGLEELDVNTGSYDVAEYVLRTWSDLHGAFIKLHPAHLLTVRNTRSSLTQIGYTFPQRELRDVMVNTSTNVQLFYLKVEEYLNEWYFSVERALYPNRKFNVGFVRVNYQQRVTSSLRSCQRSLQRRLEKMLMLRERLAKKGILSESMLAAYSPSDGLDDIEEDGFLARGDETTFEDECADDVDWSQLVRAVDMESMTLEPLVARADQLLQQFGDEKVSSAVKLAMDHLSKDDQVLLFSRYTDTVDALVEEFQKVGGAAAYIYGIYVGNKSVIVSDGVETTCTKSDIRRQLNQGRVRLMICSDAASEGLNLQAARVLINVDVPWTPARLEQRIGRVARLGQRAKSVDIYNIWYPNSIESRMYRRIQHRLDEATLAVGEYPDVVADNIKAIVLEDLEWDSDSSALLQEIRSSMQVEALSKLWSQHDSGVTTSGAVRKGLMEVCEANFACVGTQLDGAIREYQLPDEIVALTALDGCPESISLSSTPWKYVDFDLGSYGFVRDRLGNPAAFVQQSDESAVLDQECIVNLATGRFVQVVALDGRHPKMLPDTTLLDLSFAVDCAVPKRPVFWPPMQKE